MTVEYKSTLFATLITILEDDNSSLRQRTSNTITQASVVSSRAAEVLRNMVDDDGVFVVLALLDFRSEVCINDDGNDEVRTCYIIHLQYILQVETRLNVD